MAITDSVTEDDGAAPSDRPLDACTAETAHEYSGDSSQDFADEGQLLINESFPLLERTRTKKGKGRKSSSNFLFVGTTDNYRCPTPEYPETTDDSSCSQIKLPKLPRLGLNQSASDLKFEELPESMISELKNYVVSVLEQSSDGQCVLSGYENNNFEPAIRKLLTEIVISHELNYSDTKRLEPSRLKLLALAVQAAFPREDSNIYYTSQKYLGNNKKVAPNGFLYQKYLYKLDLYRRVGCLKKGKNTFRSPGQNRCEGTAVQGMEGEQFLPPQLSQLTQRLELGPDQSICDLKLEMLPDSMKSELQKFAVSVLEQSTDGQCVLSAYETNNFEPAMRKLLTEIMITYELNYSDTKRLEPTRLKLLALAIQAAFPREDSDIYYTRQVYLGNRKKVSPNGFLYQKYLYKLDLYRKAGYLVGRKNKSGAPKKCKAGAAVKDTSLQPKGDAEVTIVPSDELAWLLTEVEPFEQVAQNWCLTAEYRLSKLLDEDLEESVEEYIMKFPALHTGDGYKLFQMDFDVLHPGAGNQLFDLWPSLIPRIFQLAQRKSTNDTNLRKSIVAAVAEFPNINNCGPKEQIFLGFPILVYLFAPFNKGKNVHYTREEMKQDFYVHVANDSEKIAELAKKKEKQTERDSQKKQIRPFPVFVGTDISNLSCSVHLQDTEYVVSSPMEAFDVSFKIFHSLNLPYPEISKRQWLFLQKYVYKIELDPKDAHSNLVKLAVDLNLN